MSSQLIKILNLLRKRGLGFASGFLISALLTRFEDVCLNYTWLYNLELQLCNP